MFALCPEDLGIVQRFDVERPTPLPCYEEELGTDGACRLLWRGFGVISSELSGYALGHLMPEYPAVGDWRELPQVLDDSQAERYPRLSRS